MTGLLRGRDALRGGGSALHDDDPLHWGDHPYGADRFIAWSDQQRRRNLQQIANNSRFLILPWVRAPNLASCILGLSPDACDATGRTATGMAPSCSKPSSTAIDSRVPATAPPIGSTPEKRTGAN